jgi:hypothetical protein
MASSNRIIAAIAVFTLLPAAEAECLTQLSGIVGSGMYSQYLWRGRDYTLAGAPVSVLKGRVTGVAPVGQGLRFYAELTALNAVARRGTPWQAASADTLRLEGGAESTFFDGGRLGLGLGAATSWFYGAMIATGASYGMVMIEPSVHISLPAVYGRPEWGSIFDLTPDQVGRRGGLEWFPTFAVPWGQIEGYVGLFRPHNYLKQKSYRFLPRLFAGEIGPALATLIPSDITIGAGSLLELGPKTALYPQLELMVVPNRAQNPKQFVPAASLTFFYGRLRSRPQIHDGR